MQDIKTVLIVVLLIATGVLGYLYYDSSQHGLAIEAPSFGLKAK
jgi:hypothetical protein